MNLFFKSYRIWLIFLTLITWESCFNWGKGQEWHLYTRPWIQEIQLPSQYADIPNQSVYLDRLGHLFLGKANGLTIVVGNRSLHLYMDGPVFVTSGNGDTLFYASENDIGRLVMDEDLGFHTVSMIDLVPAAHRTFIPSDLFFSDNMLVMETDLGIYSISDDRIEFISLRMAPSGNALKDADCLEQIGDELLIGAFPEKGISILDREGRLINILGTSSSLPERNILRILPCEDRDIWVLSPHSLHKITYPSPLQILELEKVPSGRILTSMVMDNSMILGTSYGIYRASKSDTFSDGWTLKKITTGTPESIHLIASSGNQLFAAGSQHLYFVSGDQVEEIYRGTFSGMITPGKDTLFASSQEGNILYIRQYLPSGEPGSWKVEDVDPSLASSHSFISHGNEIFFLNANGIYRLTPGLRQAVPLAFHTEELLFRFIRIDSELYLLGNSRIFRFDSQEDTFLPLRQGPVAELLTRSDDIIEEYGLYWIKQQEGKYRSGVYSATHLDVFPGEYTSYPVLGELGEIIDLHIRDSVLFLTGKDRISIYDLRQLNLQESDGSVRIEWMKSSDTGLLNLDLPSSLERFSREGSLVLSHSSNDVIFSIAGLEFQSVPEPQFRYMLGPGHSDWSGWQTGREIRFHNLGRGKHRFLAQSMDLNGRIYGPAELYLTIRPPVYGTWYAFIFYGILLLIGLFLVQKWRLLSYQRVESKVSQRMKLQMESLDREKEKADRLVTELTPEKTVSDLKNKGKSKWDKYERATVLFSDIQGFTRIAEEMNPEALIDELDKFFFHFDSVVEKYNIEKIKTIGDAYMAAGGIPEKNSTNPIEVVLAALEMQGYMQHLKATRAKIWDLRIGIHTGPVIAGVVGHKKVSYDLWGDTVNTASRMESSGMPGKVNISGITYGMVKDYFICEYRGKLPVKYKGNIDMYFVNGLRPELSVDLKGIPNKRFFVNLQLLRLGDLEERIFGEVMKKLPGSLHFHKLEHARKVYNQAFLLCRSEDIDQEERLLVRTAALMLYTGLTQSYENFENRSTVISREILPSFKYTETQIDQVCNLILSTKQPFNPRNRLEKVLIDAKMEYIGRPDYPTLCQLLQREMQDAGIRITDAQFRKEQIELLSNFTFYTLAGQRLREVPAKNQIARLEHESGYKTSL